MFLIYAVTDENSFRDVAGWLGEVEKNTSESISRLLVGSKCDLEKVSVQNLGVRGKRRSWGGRIEIPLASLRPTSLNIGKESPYKQRRGIRKEIGTLPATSHITSS